MTIKQTIFSIICFTTITNNNLLAMNNENTLVRDIQGYWTPNVKSYLTTATSPDHQREDWYTQTKYIAEPWCAISNIGFLITAHSLKNSHPASSAALAFAGSASAISHVIPYHSLNILDRIGAWTAMTTVAYDAKLYKMASLSAALKNPMVLTSLLATGVTVLTDHYVAHSKYFVEKSNGRISSTGIIERKSEHKWIHVLWHILAAWTVYALLKSC
ncbi:MAG TPA: hypothetical protein VKR54_01990 [Candidatus Babeliales bacterium]|jgi:hypothetical protein|nr:hypothetical protein [Candidatus Babeliales bacterium]